MTARRSQRGYLEDTLEEIGPRLMPEHAALVGAARGLATAVDAETRVAGKQNRAVSAALWRQYREAITAVAALFVVEDDDSGHAALLALVDPRRHNDSVAECRGQYSEEI